MTATLESAGFRLAPRPVPELMTVDAARSQHHRPRWFSVLLNCLLAVAVVAMVTAVALTALGVVKVETVLSGSMRPALQPGDVEILHHEPISSVRVGQIIAIYPPKDKFIVTHRVTSVSHHGGNTYITTKGDANNTADAWGKVRIHGNEAWVVASVVPKVGYLTVWAKTGLARMVVLTVIVLVGSLYLIDRIWRGHE